MQRLFLIVVGITLVISSAANVISAQHRATVAKSWNRDGLAYSAEGPSNRTLRITLPADTDPRKCPLLVDVIAADAHVSQGLKSEGFQTVACNEAKAELK